MSLSHRHITAIIVGDAGIGKSTLARRLSGVRPEEASKTTPTIACDFLYTECEFVDGTSTTQNVRCMLIDAPGDYAFAPILPIYYRRVDCVIYVYDITSRASFESLSSRWRVEVAERAQMSVACTLIGNKLDLVERVTGRRKVTTAEAQALAKSLGAQNCYEISTLSWNSEELHAPLDMLMLSAYSNLAHRFGEKPSEIQLQAARDKTESRPCCGT